MNNTVSIVIPTGAPDTLTLSFVLSSLNLQRKYIKEVIVIEDWVYEFDTRVRKLVQSFDFCKYLRFEKPKRTPTDFRLTEARNMGMHEATGDVVVFLDEDCIPCLWYLERLLEIHNQYDSILFCAERVFLSEDYWQLVERDKWINVITRNTDRLLRKGELLKYNGVWDKTKHTSPYGIYGNNLSVRRDHINKIGQWEVFYGYGEEDVYWSYKALKQGVHGMYAKEGTDLYVCHIDHPKRLHALDCSCINRLYFYERDSEFAALGKDFQNDWCSSRIHELIRNGIDSSPVFDDLPPLPDCLKKYLKAPQAPIV